MLSKDATKYRFNAEAVDVHNNYIHGLMDDGGPDYLHRYAIIDDLVGFMGGKGGMVDATICDPYGNEGPERWVDFHEWAEQAQGDLLEWWVAEFFNHKEGRKMYRPAPAVTTRPFLAVSLSSPLQKAS